MSKHVKHTPKHRSAPSRPSLADVLPSVLPAVAAAPAKAVRTTVVVSAIAVAATGAAVSTGVVSGIDEGAAVAADLAAVTTTDTSRDTSTGDTATEADDALSGVLDATAVQEAADATAEDLLADRGDVVSRSQRRVADGEDDTVAAKESTLSAAEGPAMTVTEDIADQDPRSIAASLLGEFGFSSDQMSCLDSLWTKESNWNVYADNPTSSAYGIPQALPGSKMASAGADWATNPVTQIRWGLGYIADRYGSPCSAWGHSQAVNWY